MTDQMPVRIWMQRDGATRWDWTWHWEEIGEPDIEEVEFIRADVVDYLENPHPEVPQALVDEWLEIDGLSYLSEWLQQRIAAAIQRILDARGGG